MLILGLDGLYYKIAIKNNLLLNKTIIFKLPEEWRAEPITLRFWLGILGVKAHLKLKSWWRYPPFIPQGLEKYYRRYRRNLINIELKNNYKYLNFIYYPLIAWQPKYHITLAEYLQQGYLENYFKLVLFHNLKIRRKLYHIKSDPTKYNFLWLDYIDLLSHYSKLKKRHILITKKLIKDLNPDIIISDHGTNIDGHIPIAFISYRDSIPFSVLKGLKEVLNTVKVVRL